MNGIFRELIPLLSCAVNGITPDSEHFRGVDLQQLFQAAQVHSVAAAAAYALEQAGIRSPEFQQAYNMAVRRDILFDFEEQAILAEFRKQNIWYMPMKGALLKAMYPKSALREMSDHDILYDASKQMQTREIMLKRGFRAERFGTGHCDEYLKEPVYNFELHRCLFSSASDGRLFRYYRDFGKKLLSTPDDPYLRHFSDEDFYIYLVAHEFKHFNWGGIGIRALLDRYVFLKKKGRTLDREYLFAELDRLGIRRYERRSRKLAMKLFSSAEFPELSENEQELLSYYVSSATHGTTRHAAENRVAKHESRACFVLSRLFPGRTVMEQQYPVLCKYPVLLPAAYVRRWLRGIAQNRDKLKAEIKALMHYDYKKVQNRRQDR